jgi:serine dehydrogenase proteinase
MWPQRKKLIGDIESKTGSRLISFLTSDRPGFVAQMARDVVPLFFNHLRQLSKGSTDRLDVLIFTGGGDTLTGFALARLIREFASFVRVLVPGSCYSAGTLFALGADEIYMTRSGTLSPIDPTITTALNPVAAGALPSAGLQPGQLVPVSVESVRGFKALAAEDWSHDVKNGDELIAEAFKVLADKVHPLALGDVFRRRQQIELLAQTLLKTYHKNDDERINFIVSRLTRELGSHDYPIYRSEALELLQNQIAPQESGLEEKVLSLFDDYSEELLLGVPYNAAVTYNGKIREGFAPPVRLNQKAAIIETRDSRDVFEQTVSLTMADLQPPGQTMTIKVVQQEVIEAGWKHYS